MKKTKILYVEDEAFLAKIVKETLESKQFQVHHESDGSRVLDICRIYQPHLVILDVMLPVADGFTIGKALRKDHPTLPILYLTAKNQTTDVVQGFRSGGNDYLRKPFSLEELMVRLENLLQLSTHRRTEIANKHTELIQLGRYRFLPLRHELISDSQQYRLSYKEVALLQYLWDHRHDRIDRRALLVQVWGDDSLANSRSLDVYVTKLRRYFKTEEGVQIITLKGVGYTFVVE